MLKRRFLLLNTALMGLSTAAHAASVAVPAATPQAVSYLHLHEVLWGLLQLVGLVLPLALLWSGAAARLRNLCRRLSFGHDGVARVLMVTLYLALLALVSAPILWVRDVGGEAAFGQTPPSTAQWLVDQAVPLATKAVAAVLFLWIPYFFYRRLPRFWWAASTATLVPVAFLALVIIPVFVSPLMTNYAPLADKALAAKIERLAARCGVGPIPVFVGGSDDTVVGLGPTNRIVLEDDIAKHETQAQIEFTVAHELKHYRLGDNWIALAIIVAVLGAVFLAIHLLVPPLARFFRLEGFADPATLPLIALIAGTIWLLALPAFNWEARRIEFEADRFSLELTQQNQAAAELFAGWTKSNLSAPEFDTFFRLFRQTHPSLGERIRFANSYKPWESGQPLVYRDVCRP